MDVQPHPASRCPQSPHLVGPRAGTAQPSPKQTPDPTNCKAKQNDCFTLASVWVMCSSQSDWGTRVPSFRKPLPLGLPPPGLFSVPQTRKNGSGLRASYTSVPSLRGNPLFALLPILRGRLISYISARWLPLRDAQGHSTWIRSPVAMSVHRFHRLTLFCAHRPRSARTPSLGRGGFFPASITCVSPAPCTVPSSR